MNSPSFLLCKLLFFFLSSGFLWGQKSTDSLATLELSDLYAGFMKHLKHKDTARVYGDYYLKKAKLTNDPIKIADGYHLFFMISSPEVAMHYVDSIISLTKDLNHLNYPSRGYLNKGALLYNKDHYNEALDYYLKAKYYAKKNNNNFQLLSANLNIADLKYSLGKKSEALNIYRTNYKIIKTKDIKKTFFMHYIGITQRLVSYYLENKVPDSAFYYISEGMKMYHNSSQVYGYSDFILNSGVAHYLKGSYDHAIDSLQKYTKINADFNNGTNQPIAITYLAKCYQKKKNYESMKLYLNKVVSLVEEDKHRYNKETREAYEMLVDEYKRGKEPNQQINLLEKMIVLDSIANATQTKLNVDIYQKYDSQKLKDQRNKLLSDLKNEKSNRYIILIAFVLIALAGSYFLYRNYTKKNYYKARFDELMQSQPIVKEVVQPIQIQKETSKALNLPEEVMNDIISKLNAFELNEKFLDRSITLAKLAKKMQTNSTYLSKVINHTKKQNFANYLNDLRIDYVVRRLKNDPIFRKYTIKSISEEAGFNTTQSFASAFYKKTGIKPSYFIKNLEKQ